MPSESEPLIPSDKPSPTRGSLAVIFLTVFIDLLGFAMVLPLLPVYAKKLGQSEAMIGLLMASFSIMQFLFAPMWGRISDRIGRRPVLLVGLAGAAVFYAVFGVAAMLGSMVWLFVARIGAGIACATIPVAQAYIADSTTLENRTRGMALIGAAFGVGFCFGPLIGAAAILFSPTNVETSPWPGFAAAALSTVAFLLAVARLPESLRLDGPKSERRMIDLGAWRDALSTPSVGPLLLASFMSVLSFGGFETTLALVLKGRGESSEGTQTHASLFGFTDWEVLLYFSFIGVVLSITQGGLVRRLSGRVSEGVLASSGAVLSAVGFGLLVYAIDQVSLPLLMVSSAVEVMGFAFMTPSLQSLMSRRSDPEKQGSIAGVSQSVSALARIAGPLIALPLFGQSPSLPYLTSAGLMLLSLVVMQIAVRTGRDYGSPYISGGLGH